MGIEFFKPKDPFGVGSDWELQTGDNPNTTEQRASALGKDGDEIAWKGYGKQTALTATYIATKASGDLAVPKVGKVENGCHINTLNVVWNQTGYPVMTVSGHKHDHGKAHDKCRTYSPSILIPAKAIGVPRIIKNIGTSGANVFSLKTGSEIDVRGMTYTLGCNHVDEMDAEGGQLAGDNYDGVETLAVELTGESSKGTDYEFDAAWHDGTVATTQGNTVATKGSVTLTRHVKHDTVEPSP